MAYDLTTPEEKITIVSKLNITSFAVDIAEGNLHVAYDELDSAGNVLSEKLLTLQGQDMLNTIGLASQIAGVDIYTPIKESLYTQIATMTGKAGVVS